MLKGRNKSFTIFSKTIFISKLLILLFNYNLTSTNFKNTLLSATKAL